MRSMWVLAAFAVVLFSVLMGCDADQKVYGPAPVVPTNPPANSPMASFQQDVATTTNGVAVSAYAYAADDVWLNVVALWASHPLDGVHPTSADVLLRIDPGASPEVLQTDLLGSWCLGSPLEVTPTGTPGEWRIRRASGADDCTCGDPWADWGSGSLYQFGGVRLKLHTPGTWRVEVSPASATPACECEQGCFTGLSFFGGTLTVPAS